MILITVNGQFISYFILLLELWSGPNEWYYNVFLSVSVNKQLWFSALFKYTSTGHMTSNCCKDRTSILHYCACLLKHNQTRHGSESHRVLNHYLISPSMLRETVCLIDLRARKQHGQCPPSTPVYPFTVTCSQWLVVFSGGLGLILSYHSFGSVLKATIDSLSLDIRFLGLRWILVSVVSSLIA